MTFGAKGAREWVTSGRLVKSQFRPSPKTVGTTIYQFRAPGNSQKQYQFCFMFIIAFTGTFCTFSAPFCIFQDINPTVPRPELEGTTLSQLEG